MANFGESFSRSFISGYGAGKAIKDDWAAGEYADDVEKQNKLHDEAVEKAGPSKAEDFQKYEGEKKTALEENRKAFMGSDEMSPATEDWVPTRAEHDALGKNEKFQSATKGLADTAKYESDRAKAISDADAALVKGTREAQKKFYGRTGDVEKLAKMQKDDVWVERLMNPEKGKAFLLDYYNKNMAPEGTTFAAGPNGNLVQYDAQGRIVNDNIPMPSKAEMRQMMAQAYGMEKLFDGDTSIYKMLVDQDISRTKAKQTALQNEAQRQHWNNQDAAAMLRAQNTGKTGAKKETVFGNQDAEGNLPIMSEKGATGFKMNSHTGLVTDSEGAFVMQNGERMDSKQFKQLSKDYAKQYGIDVQLVGGAENQTLNTRGNILQILGPKGVPLKFRSKEDLDLYLSKRTKEPSSSGKATPPSSGESKTPQKAIPEFNTDVQPISIGKGIAKAVRTGGYTPLTDEEDKRLRALQSEG